MEFPLARGEIDNPSADPCYSSPPLKTRTLAAFRGGGGYKKWVYMALGSIKIIVHTVNKIQTFRRKTISDILKTGQIYSLIYILGNVVRYLYRCFFC